MNTEPTDNKVEETTSVQASVEVSAEAGTTNSSDQQDQKPLGQSISQFVKQDIAKQLMEMGYSKNVAEKACFHNNNVIEKAIEWIYMHQHEEDFETEERIQEFTDGPKEKISDEEAKKRAKEIQDKMSAKYKEKQRILEEEQEKNRIRTNREMAEARKKLEEAENERFIEQFKHKKKEEEDEKRRMREILARDKEERFGKKFNSETQSAVKVKTVIDDVEYYIKAIKTLYPTFRCGDQAKNCMSTIRVILNNIVKNPTEEKFRKAKTTNPNFQERIGHMQAGMKLLDTLGFKPEGEFLVVKDPVFDDFSKTIELLDKEIEKLS